MLVYRISKKEFIRDLSGTGAGLYGGRWNPKGINMLYTAGNIALAYVEFLVHNYHLLKTVEVCLACIEVPDNIEVVSFDMQQFPEDWQNKVFETQKMGKNVFKQGVQVLKAPSAIVPGEYNYLLNPLHEKHVAIKIQKIIDPFPYDHRLLEKK